MSRASLRLDAVFVQAVIAGALSFSHLHDLADAAGQDGWKAWAYPISVDLLLVAAWRRMRLQRAAGDGARAAWSWFTVALVASLGANVSTAGLLDLGHVPAWLRILVAGWPALAFLGGTLLAHTPSTTAPEPTTTAPEPEPVAVPPAPPVCVERAEPETAPAPEVESPEPARPELDPAPAPAAVPLSVPGVPPALLDQARTVADSHRATTGRPIDADTLRARLGLPANLAASITAQLT